MRPIALLFAASACLTFPSIAPAQQMPTFKPGEPVDFYTFGKWVPCTVEAPLAANNYTVSCGSISMRAKNDPRQLRVHVVPPLGVQMAFGIETAPAPSPEDAVRSIGARYGTREPRLCDRRPAQFTAAQAKDVFICDAEHEFNGNLFLVSDVLVNMTASRPFDPSVDARRPEIDPSQPVLDIRATYNNYQCGPIPASHFDNPNIRTCNKFHTSNAAGGCYRNTAGDWHCSLLDFGASTIATAKNVSPPTLID